MSVFSQDKSIGGIIYSEDSGRLEYANIFIKGTTVGTITDTLGQFILKIPANTDFPFTIVGSYIGHKPSEIIISQEFDFSQPLDIKLRIDENSLDKVVVTASFFSTGDKKGVTLTPLEVLRTPGAAADVMMAIQTFPDVQQVEEGAGLYVRGGDVSETVFIIDGAYLYHPYKYESPSGGYFGAIPASLLKSMFFSTGGYGVEYTNSISGALIMESYDVPERFKGTVDLGLSNSGLRFLVPVLREELGMSFSVNYSNTNNLYKLNKPLKEFQKRPTSYDLNYNVVYKHDKGHIKLFLFREADQIGVAMDDPTKAGFYIGKNSYDLGNVSIKHDWSDYITSHANIAYSHYIQRAILYDKDINVKNYIFQFSSSTEFYISKMFTSKIGLDVISNHQTIKGYLTFEDDELFQSEIFDLDVDYMSNQIGLYNKWIVNLRPGLNITVGARWEHESLSKENIWDFRGSLSWKFWRKWSLVASVGRYHQFAAPENYDDYYGNPKLGSLNALHYIVGVAREADNNIFRVEYYYKDYRNIVLEDPEVNVTNKGYGYATGLDIFYKKVWYKFSGRISLSLLETKRKWNSVHFLSRTQYDIPCTFNIIGEYSINDYISIGAKYRTASGKLYTSSKETYRDKRLPAYETFDVNLNFLYSFFPNNTTSLYLTCTNIFNKKNITGYKYDTDYTERVPLNPALARYYYFGFQFSF